MTIANEHTQIRAASHYIKVRVALIMYCFSMIKLINNETNKHSDKSYSFIIYEVMTNELDSFCKFFMSVCFNMIQVMKRKRKKITKSNSS